MWTGSLTWFWRGLYLSVGSFMLKPGKYGNYVVTNTQRYVCVVIWRWYVIAPVVLLQVHLLLANSLYMNMSYH